MPLPLLLERARPRILWPSLAGFSDDRRRRSGRLLLASACPRCLRGLAIGALAVALARPQTVGGVTRIAGQGVAIVVALDQSSSMNTVDFPADRDTRRISRLEAAKNTFIRFVAGRPDDLIGLVVFANYPDLACPPTLDHRFLVETAAGDPRRPGQATTARTSATRSPGHSRPSGSRRPAKKVLVLLTDGNNEPAGPHPLDPEKAADPGARPGRDPAHDRHRPARRHRPRRPIAKTDLPVMTEVEGPNIALLERLAEITGGRRSSPPTPTRSRKSSRRSAPWRRARSGRDPHPLR